MYIEYLGHSCFYLKGKDRSVVTDPFGDIGFPLKRAECDFVLSSHGHFDHNNFGGVKAEAYTEDFAEKTGIFVPHGYELMQKLLGKK